MRIQEIVDELARLTGAVVTLEDLQGQIITHSLHPHSPELLDDARVQTILARRVPEAIFRYLQDRGIYREIAQQCSLVRIGPFPEIGLDRRVAVAVRWEGEVVAFIWFAGLDESIGVLKVREIMRAAEELGRELGTEVTLESLYIRNLLRLLVGPLDAAGELAISDALERTYCLAAPFV